MHRILMYQHWPKTDGGQVMFADTNHALLYALVIFDDARLCQLLEAQLHDLHQSYYSLKAQPHTEIGKLSDLAFAIQFTREASEEVSDLQSRALAYAG